MVTFAPDTIVSVRPFDSRIDGDTVTIGDVERQVFLAIPAEALGLLRALAAGRTVAEAAREYEDRYQESPDMDDFLTAMEAEGFVGDPAPVAEAHPTPRQRSWSMNWLAPATARRLLSWPVMLTFAAIIVVGSAAQVDDPTIMP